MEVLKLSDGGRVVFDGRVRLSYRLLRLMISEAAADLDESQLELKSVARVFGGVLDSGPGSDDQVVEMVTLHVATRVSSWSVSTRGAVLVSCGSLFSFGLGLFGSL
ncbi:hypothetical protein Rs2_34248 [Raphanus sativus]|nr:hypothetical protein Rs2_34248 [Raphanus sativus]